jgi:hypothetical protein
MLGAYRDFGHRLPTAGEMAFRAADAVNDLRPWVTARSLRERVIDSVHLPKRRSAMRSTERFAATPSAVPLLRGVIELNVRRRVDGSTLGTLNECGKQSCGDWAMRNETDRNDARGIAQMRLGWFRAVHVKNIEMQKMRTLLTDRKLLKRKLVDIENHIRGALRTYGLFVGAVGRGHYEARVRELIKRTDFAKRSSMLRAIVAVARKLAGILHRMWIDASDFKVGFGAKVTQRLKLKLRQ